MSRFQSIVLSLLSSVSVCGGLSACDSELGSSPPQAEPPAQPRATERPAAPQEPRTASVDVVETRAALRSLYGARHTDDLPTRDTIEAHPGGEDAVRWLAEHDKAVAVRARALASLRMFPNDASEAVVRSVLVSSDNPASLRSAALRALDGWDLNTREDLRTLAITGLQSDDATVAIAAAQVLGGVPEATEALEQRLSESPTPPIERAIRSSL